MQCPRCDGRTYHDGLDIACIACGWRDYRNAAEHAQRRIEAEEAARREYLAQTRAENLSRERAGLPPLPVDTEVERIVRIGDVDPVRAYAKPIQTDEHRAAMRRAARDRLKATRDLVHGPTEEQMVIYLRARGYDVRTPEELRERGRRGGMVGGKRRVEILGPERTAEIARIARAARSAALHEDPPPHGDPRRYWRATTRCRCQLCKDAMTRVNRELRERKREREAARSTMALEKGVS